MAELKKCPFCGGEAEIDYLIDVGNETHWFIYCRDCSCELEFNAKTSKEQAIEAWNNRATEADIRAKAIDEFAEKLSDAYSEHSTTLRLHGVDFDILTVDGAIEIMWDLVSEQLKEE